VALGLALCVFAGLGALALRVFADDCPPQGDGGDRDLNKLKNRAETPRSAVTMAVRDLVRMRSVRTRRNRARWTREQSRSIGEIEGAAVRVEGYVVSVREEGAEAANCHGDGHDLHVTLSEALGGRDLVVVEITPRMRKSSWTTAAVRALLRRRVRVTGWLMYDQEHAPGDSRSTSWEVHPVTGVEVFADGSWRDL